MKIHFLRVSLVLLMYSPMINLFLSRVMKKSFLPESVDTQADDVTTNLYSHKRTTFDYHDLYYLLVKLLNCE